MDQPFDGPATSKLLLWGDAPPSERARRLWEFMGVHLQRGEEAVRQPRTFELEHVGTLRSLLDTLAAKAGVLVARELPALVERPVTLALANTTLLGALDAGCAQVGAHGGQRARGELIVHEGPEPRFPAAYAGPLRIRMCELRSTRSTDFATASVASHARLRAEWEWPVGPVGPLAIRIHGDERRYEAASVTNVHHVGMVAEQLIDLPNASPVAVAGSVSAMFEGRYDELRIPIGSSATLHGLSVTTVPLDGECHLQLDTLDEARVAGTVDLGVSPLILGITASGEQGIPQIHRMRVANKASSERWGLRFRDGFGQLVEVRLRIAAAPIRGTFAFALPPTPLP